MLVVVVLIFGVAQRLVSGSFGELERRHVHVTTHRAANIVMKRVERIDSSLADWSAWDAAYQFITENDPTFVPENLIPESLVRLDLDIVVVLDGNGGVRFAEMLSPDLESFVPVPESVITAIRPGGDLYFDFSEHELHRGAAVFPEGILLIGLRPIMHTDGSGPQAGTLVFAKWVSPSLLESFTDTSLAEVTLTPVEPASHLTEHVNVSALSDEAIRGDMVLADIHGTPRIGLGVVSTREIYQHGRRTMNVLLIAMGGISVAYAAIISALLSRIVIKRVRQLCVQAATVAANGSALQRVEISGSDEISELAERMNEMLQSIDGSRRSAEASSRAKSDFLANMSHEIRTPMTAILGYADLLVDPMQTPEERSEAVRTIRRNGEHLLAVINDILDVSKIEAGRMTTESIMCSPLELARDVYSMMQARAVEKGIKLQLEPVYPLPATIRTDPLRLRQILVNLVSNATKFTDLGSVTLRVSFEQGREPKLRFDIIDTGIGMSREQLDNVFAPFWQADSSTVRIFGGTGLGLSISRRLARMLCGDIAVESCLGAGSTFTLRISPGDLTGVEKLEMPSEAVRTSDAPSEAPTSKASALSGMRVLLAEDGRDNQRLISFHLRKAGAEVVCVGDGALAVASAIDAEANGHAFDVILMDMQMPVMDGYTATGVLRKQGYTRPIIALTAHAMSGDREKCMNAGCDEFLTKPIEASQLIYTCRILGLSSPPPSTGGVRRRI